MPPCELVNDIKKEQKPPDSKQDGVETKKQDGIEIFEKRCWLSLSVIVYFVRMSYIIKKGRCRRVDW